jgi:hypothetical protein
MLKLAAGEEGTGMTMYTCCNYLVLNAHCPPAPLHPTVGLSYTDVPFVTPAFWNPAISTEEHVQ